MTYTIIKAIHIIFIVSYFAGLFYLVRLFVYHSETKEKPEPERSILQKQYIFMQRKLWNIITAPSALIVLFSGLSMLYMNYNFLLKKPWIHLKLTFVFVLIIYHIWTWVTLNKMVRNTVTYKSIKLRMLNEVATLLLFVIVFIAILKDAFLANWYWALVSFFGFGVLIMLVVRLVNRKKK